MNLSSITNLAKSLGIVAEDIAPRLGIERYMLNALDSGHAYMSPMSIDNAAARLGTVPSNVARAYAECRARSGMTPLPFDLRDRCAKAQAAYATHRDDPLPYLASIGVTIERGQIPRAVLALEIQRRVLSTDTVMCQLPGVEDLDEFRVLGYIADVPEPEGAIEH